MLDALARANPLEELQLLYVQLLWYDQKDRSSQHFVHLVAIKRGRAGVPRLNAPLERHAHDGIERGFDHGRKVSALHHSIRSGRKRWRGLISYETHDRRRPFLFPWGVNPDDSAEFPRLGTSTGRTSLYGASRAAH